MGAWENTAFGNDDAMDWLDEFSEHPDAGQLIAAVVTITNNDDYIEATEGAAFIAALEIIVWLQTGVSEEVKNAEFSVSKEQKEAMKSGITPNVIAAVYHAVEKVLNPGISELAELWADEDDEYEAWKQQVVSRVALLS